MVEKCGTCQDFPGKTGKPCGVREDPKKSHEGCKFHDRGADTTTQLGRIPQELIDPTPVRIDELKKEFMKNIHVDEDVNITIPISFVIGNFTPADPDAMCIVAASGSGKTEVIRAIGDTENQYAYPVSSLTSHTLLSGLKDGFDLAPRLQNRLVTIKDFTTILSKNRDEVAAIFADLRDLLDGYLQKTFGSKVGKKECKGLHSSLLLASTNAIERYYSIYSILGQRLIFFRPVNDARKARQKAISNAGKEKEIREQHHKVIMQFVFTVLKEQHDRLDLITRGVSSEMKERIGRACEFLAIVRTHINRDQRGDMCALPESELPTRLTKTLCKIVDAHSIIHNRTPTLEDEMVALRLIYDNVPTERLLILKVLAESFPNGGSTSEIEAIAGMPNAYTKRVLEDLSSLSLVKRVSRDDKESTNKRADTWSFPDNEFKTVFLVVVNYRILPAVNDELKGVNRVGLDKDTNNDTISYVKRNLLNNKDITIDDCVVSALCEYLFNLPDLHPAVNQDALPHLESCGICGQPLNGDAVYGPAGTGRWHALCQRAFQAIRESCRGQHDPDDEHVRSLADMELAEEQFSKLSEGQVKAILKFYFHQGAIS